MRRIRVQNSSDKAHRWMVSYADLMTLLLAFFVVMYAVSNVSEGKYRVLSNTLKAAFSERPFSFRQVKVKPEIVEVKQAIDPIGFESLQPMPAKSVGSMHNSSMNHLSDELADIFSDVAFEDGAWKVSNRDDGIAVELSSDIVFETADATVRSQFVPIIDRVAQIVQDKPFSLQVEGFTDDRPIQSARYPSNWELSGARSAAVVHRLQRAGVAPDRLSFAGFGEYQPVDSNTSEEGRMRNRRVILVLRPLSRL